MGCQRSIAWPDLPRRLTPLGRRRHTSVPADNGHSRPGSPAARGRRRPLHSGARAIRAAPSALRHLATPPRHPLPPRLALPSRSRREEAGSETRATVPGVPRSRK
eukprot:101155-Chlamydomonas_euryale.AAC.1